MEVKGRGGGERDWNRETKSGGVVQRERRWEGGVEVAGEVEVRGRGGGGRGRRWEGGGWEEEHRREVENC